MVQHIRSAFIDNLQDVKWMDSKTKRAAVEKVTGMISDNFNVSASLRALSPCHLEESWEVRREPHAKGDAGVRAWGRKEIFAARSRFLLLLTSLAITGDLARRLLIRKRNHCNVHFTPRKVIQDSFGFWIPRHWFRILSQWKSDSGFQSLVGSKFLELYSRFHEKTVWIPDSGLPYMGLLIDCKETLIAR